MSEKSFEETTKQMVARRELMRVEDGVVTLNIGGSLNRLEFQKQLRELKEEQLEQFVRALAELSNKISAMGMLAIKEGMERSALLTADTKGVH